MSSSESDDWNWNPTFVTPDGEPVTVERTRDDGYRDPETLRELHIEQGLSMPEIADRFDIGVRRIGEQLQRHDIPADYTGVVDYYREGDAEPVTPGPKPGAFPSGSDPIENVDDDGPFECPECGESYDTRAEESACIAQHARDVADASPEVFG